MRIIPMIVIPVILLFGVALLIMWLPLPRPLPPALGSARTAIAAATTGVLGLVYLVGIGIYLVATVRQASQVLDPILLSRGMSVQADVGVGRVYRGQVDGRTVEVAFVAGRALDRSLLNVTVTADVGTRAALGAQRPLLDCRQCPSVEVATLPSLQVVAQDEGWVRTWLAAPGSQAALEGMLGAGSGGGARELYVQPERLWLRARPNRVDPEQVSGWLDDLLWLASVAEGGG